jgi:hypothetical protein
MMVDETKKCSLHSCPDVAVTCLAQQALCLEHFLSRCYEDLDRFDVRGRSADGNSARTAALKAFVDECSQRALEVSLQCQGLDNLQRGRLLDILLWAGELMPETGTQALAAGSRGR